ncbi:MAG: hypothetical protein WA919_26175 [Coleofasciculaceae cyanobacterium]
MTNSLTINISLFLLAAIVIGLAGTKLAAVADKLADATGLGEAVVGALLLGGTTSLAGIVTSFVAASGGHPELAVSNALGGIVAQTAFLAVADITYRKANLEHAAASLATIVQGTLLITLLAIPLMAMASPPIQVFGIHPVTLLLPLGYVFGLGLTNDARLTPMWIPKRTAETLVEEQEEIKLTKWALVRLWLGFILLALLTAVGGYALARTGIAIAMQTGLSETIVGGLFTAVSTSLPELVTAIAAVKQGALTLAVSGIIGGNSFDVLMLALSDLAYRQGSIYHALGQQQVFVIALSILMTSVLLLGLLRREKYGIGNIGFESFMILILYLGGFFFLFLNN